MVAVLALGTGCGAEDSHPDYDGGALGAGGSDSDDPRNSDTHSHQGSCPEGSVRDCRITIHQASGVTSCWDGVQFCEDGTWGGCMNPDDVESADPTVMEPSR